MDNSTDPLVRSGFLEAEEITQRHAKTFYFASRFLPKKKRYASYAIYAICRISDHSVDAKAELGKRENLDRIRENIALAYSSEQLNTPVLSAFRTTALHYQIPKEYFDELLLGMEMDLVKNRYQTMEELYSYCYRVAGVVGLMMLNIFGAKSPLAQEPAISLGIAMQLTNILRDIKEDSEMGRIYLPLDELHTYHLDEINLIASKPADEHFKNFMKFQIARARDYYQKSSAGIKLINGRRSRFVVLLMKNIYAGILQSIEQNDYDVFSLRAHVSLSKKILLTLTTLCKGEYL